MKFREPVYTGPAYTTIGIAVVNPCTNFSIPTDKLIYTAVLHSPLLALAQSWAFQPSYMLGTATLLGAQTFCPPWLSGLQPSLMLARYTLAYKLNSAYAALKRAGEVVLAPREPLNSNHGQAFRVLVNQDKKRTTPYYGDKPNRRCDSWQSVWPDHIFTENYHIFPKIILQMQTSTKIIF